MLVKDVLRSVPGDISGGQLRGRDLVQQWLELVVVALVDQRDVHAFFAGEFLRAADTGEAATDDHDRRVRQSPLSSVESDQGSGATSPGLDCMMPPSTKIVVAAM